ncbi:hypothetical protein VTK26DRAFT_2460 [Humicola hyalothermophila]
MRWNSIKHKSRSESWLPHQPRVHSNQSHSAPSKGQINHGANRIHPPHYNHRHRPNVRRRPRGALEPRLIRSRASTSLQFSSRLFLVGRALCPGLRFSSGPTRGSSSAPCPTIARNGSSTGTPGPPTLCSGPPSSSLICCYCGSAREDLVTFVMGRGLPRGNLWAQVIHTFIIKDCADRVRGASPPFGYCLA